MRRRERLIAALKARKPDLRRMGILSLSLFGSSAHGEAKTKSDIDLLVRYDRKARLSLIDVVHIENYLGRLFKRPVQLVSDPVKRKSIRERIEAERIHVF